MGLARGRCERIGFYQSYSNKRSVGRVSVFGLRWRIGLVQGLGGCVV